MARQMTKEEYITFMVNEIALKYGCHATLDFETNQMKIDGDPVEAQKALNEIERTAQNENWQV